MCKLMLLRVAYYGCASCALLQQRTHRTHTSSRALSTWAYTIRHAATTPCLYNEINQWLILIVTLARNVWLPDDDLRIETCRSNFNVLMWNFYVCASVGILIKWYFSCSFLCGITTLCPKFPQWTQFPSGARLLSPLLAVYSSYPTLRRLAVLSSSDTSNIFSIYLRQCKMPNVIGLYESTILEAWMRISIPPRSLMPKAHLLCLRNSHIKQPIKQRRIAYG